MANDTQHIALSHDDLALIDAALQTQEKILAVQSRAGGTLAASRLENLQALSRRLDGHRPRAPRVSLWTRLRCMIACPAGRQPG